MASETKGAGSDEAKKELEGLEMDSNVAIRQYVARVNVLLSKLQKLRLRREKFIGTPLVWVYTPDMMTRYAHLIGGKSLG